MGWLERMTGASTAFTRCLGNGRLSTLIYRLAMAAHLAHWHQALLA